MKNNLHITIVSNSITWDCVQFNLEKIEHQLEGQEPSDLIVLPEMFATGFIVDDSLPSPTDSARILEWMQQLSQKSGAAVTGSVAVCDNDLWYNRLYFVTPEGGIMHYDKRHLFPLSPEAQFYQPGTKLPIFEYKDWRICPQICYDLRFPKFCRNEYANGEYKYDILIYVANWPAARAETWNTLLRARAIENQSYVIACNCVGEDPRKCFYQGDSQIVDPSGSIHIKQDAGKHSVIQSQLSATELERIRQVFPFAKDAD